jgi:RNA polymerase primary sigma factor
MKRCEFITPLGSAASKTNAMKQKEELPKKDGPETAPDRPPIDLWDDAVKKLIRGAKKRGYVTHDQINALVPSEEVQSEQIEDILVMFSEMGVNVVETKEAEPEETPEDAKEEPEGIRTSAPSRRRLASASMRPSAVC